MGDHKDDFNNNDPTPDFAEHMRRRADIGRLEAEQAHLRLRILEWDKERREKEGSGASNDGAGLDIGNEEVSANKSGWEGYAQARAAARDAEDRRAPTEGETFDDRIRRFAREEMDKDHGDRPDFGFRLDM